MTNLLNQAPVMNQELLVSSLAQTDTLAKLLLDKRIITQQQFMRKIADERATYRRLINPRVRSISFDHIEKVEGAWGDELFFRGKS